MTYLSVSMQWICNSDITFFWVTWCNGFYHHLIIAVAQSRSSVFLFVYTLYYQCSAYLKIPACYELCVFLNFAFLLCSLTDDFSYYFTWKSLFDVSPLCALFPCSLLSRFACLFMLIGSRNHATVSTTLDPV
jgi:hypothetical protein